MPVFLERSSSRPCPSSRRAGPGAIGAFIGSSFAHHSITRLEKVPPPFAWLFVTWLFVGGSIREGTQHRARSVPGRSDIDVYFLWQLVLRPRPGISSRKPYGELATVHCRMPSVRRPLAWRAPMRAVCCVRLSFITAHRARRNAARPPSMSVVTLNTLACADAGGCCCCSLCRALLHLLLPAMFDDHVGRVA